MFAVDRLETFAETAEENSKDAKEKAAAIIASARRNAALFFESQPVSRKLE
jgi:F0F1-type ATP synthase membrane subunit b/b'